MPGPAIALGAGMVGSSIIGAVGARNAGKAQMAASKRAADANLQGTRESIAFQKEQGEIARELMDPFREAGLVGLEQLMELGGMAGPEAEAAAIQQIAESEPFKFYEQQALQGQLAGASATGGLRGGDVQRGLAELRPALLQNFVDQRYGKLAGLATSGQAAAAGQSSGAMALGANLGQTAQLGGQLQAKAHTQYGQARAGSSLGQAQAYGNMVKGLGQIYAADKMGLLT